MRTKQKQDLNSHLKLKCVWVWVRIKTKNFSYFSAVHWSHLLKKKPLRSWHRDTQHRADHPKQENHWGMKWENKEIEIKNLQSWCIPGSWTLFVTQNEIIFSHCLPNFIAKDHFMVTGLTVDPNSCPSPPPSWCHFAKSMTQTGSRFVLVWSWMERVKIVPLSTGDPLNVIQGPAGIPEALIVTSSVYVMTTEGACHLQGCTQVFSTR